MSGAKSVKWKTGTADKKCRYNNNYEKFNFSDNQLCKTSEMVEWLIDENIKIYRYDTDDFSLYIPFSMLMVIAQDYKKIILNVR